MDTVRGRIAYPVVGTNTELTAQQNENMLPAFRQFIEQTRPARFLEIGTAGGGTITYIKDLLNELNLTSPIKTFEVKEHKWYPFMRDRGIEVIIDNIFDYSYRNIAKPELIDSYIQQEGISVILCDGGSKINEFRILSEFLKTGDIIMAHDYVDTKSNFEENYKGKIWNWREIGSEHIDPVSEQYNLTPYMQDIFAPAAWACRQKQ
jgi:hypothetical protein